MRYLMILILCMFCEAFAFAQTNKPTPITPQILEKIKAEVEKEIPVFKDDITMGGFTKNQIEFSVDTFRIEHILAKRMNIDFSTDGMNKTVEEATASYDKLLNKYYDKLMKILKPEDKQVLISAEENWIKYRDTESKFIWVMAKDVYSGGGTMQSNIATGSCSNIVIQRTIEIFNYFDYIIKDK